MYYVRLLSSWLRCFGLSPKVRRRHLSDRPGAAGDVRELKPRLLVERHGSAAAVPIGTWLVQTLDGVVVSVYNGQDGNAVSVRNHSRLRMRHLVEV